MATLIAALRRALWPAALVALAMAACALAALALHGHALTQPRAPALVALTGGAVLLPGWLGLAALALLAHRLSPLWLAVLGGIGGVLLVIGAPPSLFALLFREVDGGEAEFLTRAWAIDLIEAHLGAAYLFMTAGRAFLFPALPAVPLVVALMAARLRAN
jgi:hypothetical protein